MVRSTVNPGGVPLDDECGDAAACALLRIGQRHDDGEVRAGDSAYPDLAAVDDPVRPLLHGTGRHARRIAPGPRLRYGDGGMGLAAGIGFHVEPLLPLVGHGEQHVEVGRVGREHERRDRAAEFLVDADQRRGRQVHAADLLGRVERPQAELPAFPEERAAFLGAQRELPAGGFACEHDLLQRHEFVVDELGHQLAQHHMFLHEVERHHLAPFGFRGYTGKGHRPRHPAGAECLLEWTG